MKYKGVKAARILSVILAAAMIINNSQTACAYTQASFAVDTEEEILLQEFEEEPQEETEQEETIPEESTQEEIFLEEETLESWQEDDEAVTAQDFVLSEEELEIKEDLIENDVLSDLVLMEEGVDYVKDQVIALASDNEEAQRIAEAYGGELTDFSYGIATISLEDSELTVVEAFEYGIDPDNNIPAVEPDYLLSIDEPEAGDDSEDASLMTWDQQYYVKGNNDPLLNPAVINYQWHHEAIHTFDAWNLGMGSSDVVVAVIDSGVKTDHEDLKDAIVDNYDQVNADTLSIGMNDSNEDRYGHGTHVAGIIAATAGNEKGGAGIAPGAKIMPINVCNPDKNPGSPIISYMAKAMLYAAGARMINGKTYYFTRRADIINLSIGSKTYNATLKSAVDTAYEQGVTIVAAMGNDGTNIACYPARYDHVIGVCATRKDNTLADFSDYGQWADVSAPGADIYSSLYTGNGDYGSKSGTSMATPVVVGACALYMSYKGYTNPDDMEKVLESTSTPVANSNMGAGVINVSAMLEAKENNNNKAQDNDDDDIIIIEDPDDPEEPEEPEKLYPVKTLVINNGKGITLKHSATEETETAILTITKLKDKKNNDLLENKNYEKIRFSWSSSDTGVIRLVKGFDEMGQISARLVAVSAGTSTITCKAMDGSGKKATCKVTVKGDKKITAIALEPYNGADSGNIYIKYNKKDVLTSIQLCKDIPDDYSETGNEKMLGSIRVRVLQSAENALDSDISQPVWKCSNPKIVRMDVGIDGKSIFLTPLTKGTAKITCKVSDGSGKTASFKVKVVQLVTSVSISGQSGIESGSKAAFTATVLPKNANSRAVRWEVGRKYGNAILPVNGVSISSKGKVSVTEGISYDDDLYVRAIATDSDYVQSNAVSFRIAPKAKKVFIDTGYQSTTLGTEATKAYSNSIEIKAFSLSSTILSDKSAFRGRVSITSSDPKVAAVSETVFDEDERITTATVAALKKGTVTITCKATDGSGKKATLKLTVKNTNGTRILTPEILSTVNQIELNISSVDDFYNLEKTSDGYKLKLYNVNLPIIGEDSLDENSIALPVVALSSNGMEYSVGKNDLEWKSSNSNIVSVSEEGVLTGVSEGRATVTCSVKGLSRVQAKIVTDVVIPASSLTLTVKDNQNSSIAYGGSCTYVATVGKAYGEPTNSGVTWDYDIVGIKNSGGSVYLKNFDSELFAQITQSGSFFTFSEGKITVDSQEDFEANLKIYGYKDEVQVYRDFGIIVYAKTTDDRAIEKNTSVIRATTPTTDISFYRYIRTDEMSDGKNVYKLSEEPSETVVLSISDKDNDNPALFSVTTDKGASNSAYRIQSDNPLIAAAFYGKHTNSGKNGLVIYPYATGEANIVITMRDGSGFKRSLKVVVVD